MSRLKKQQSRSPGGTQLRSGDSGLETAAETGSAYRRFVLNRYSTPTEMAKLTSVWVFLAP